MGFAAGFNAGSSAVQRGVANAIAYKKMKEKKDAEAEEKIAASNKAAKEVNEAAKKTAIEIVAKQSNLVKSINLSKSISEHTANTTAYNSYQEEAALMLNDARFNTTEAISDIGRLDLSPREAFQSVEISDGKGGVVSVNIPSSLAGEANDLVLGIDDGKIYKKGYDQTTGQEKSELNTIANIPTVTFPEKEGSLNGYDIGIDGEMYKEEQEYFVSKNIDPSKVSRKVLQSYRLDKVKKEKLTDFDKTRALVEENSKLKSDIYAGKTNIESVTREDIFKINAIERVSNFPGLGKKEKQLIRNSEQTLATGQRLTDVLNEIGNEKIHRGMFDTIQSKLQTWISDGSWDTMDEEAKKKALLSIRVNTKLGNALAQYIKSISGTAVAQSEYDRLLKVFTSGNFSNIQSLKESVGTFYSDLAESHHTRLNDNLLEGGSFILNKLKTHNKRFGSTEKEPKKEPNEISKRPPTFEEAKSKHPNLTREQYNRIIGGK